MVNRKIKIVVACGAAIAQSSMLQMMISSYLDKKKVNYEIQKCTFYELQNKVNSWNPDFVYTVGQPPFQMREGLHHDGMSIFTGVGRDKTLDDLYDMIQKLEDCPPPFPCRENRPSTFAFKTVIKRGETVCKLSKVLSALCKTSVPPV